MEAITWLIGVRQGYDDGEIEMNVGAVTKSPSEQYTWYLTGEVTPFAQKVEDHLKNSVNRKATD